MGKSFHERLREAARLRRTTIQDTRRQIASIYERAIADLILKAENAGSLLTRQWAETYVREMKARIHEIWLQVDELTKAGMAQAAGSAVAAQVDLLTSAAELYGLDMRNRFAATFAHTPDEAIASVLQGSLYKGKSAALSKRIWKWEALQGGQIEDAVTQAIAQDWSANDLANALRGFVREDAEGGSNVYDLFDPDKASYNARRLATTAINHAYWSATMMAAHDNPFAEFLHWELSAAGNHCPYCIDYAAHDEGLGIGNFPLESAPLPHPWCTCLWYVDSTKSLAEVGRELYQWEQGESNPKLDKAFGDWKADHKIPAASFAGQINPAHIESMKPQGPNDVILTDERLEHIQKRHPGDFTKYGKYLAKVLEDPDFILLDEKHDSTAIWVRRIEEAQAQLRATVRVQTDSNISNRQHSILTYQYIRKREYDRIKRKIVATIYRRPN